MKWKRKQLHRVFCEIHTFKSMYYQLIYWIFSFTFNFKQVLIHNAALLIPDSDQTLALGTPEFHRQQQAGPKAVVTTSLVGCAAVFFFRPADLETWKKSSINCKIKIVLIFSINQV